MRNQLLAVACRVAWDQEAWRDPALVYFLIKTIEPIAADESETSENRAEAEMLISKLYKAMKRPPLM